MDADPAAIRLRESGEREEPAGREPPRGRPLPPILPPVLSMTLHGIVLMVLSLVVVAFRDRTRADDPAIALTETPPVPPGETLDEPPAASPAPDPEAPVVEVQTSDPVPPLPRRFRPRERMEPLEAAADPASREAPLGLADGGPALSLGRAFLDQISPAESPAPAPKHPAAPPLLSARFGAMKEAAIRRHGGTEATETAVLASLHWLAKNQQARGHWLGPPQWPGYERNDPTVPKMPPDFSKAYYEPAPPPANAPAYAAWQKRHQEMEGRWTKIWTPWRQNHPDRSLSAALTGLSVLAFQGAGHTEAEGEFRDNVRRGLYWLESVQGKDGSYAENTYGHAIATLAMAESAGMGGSHRESLARGVAQLLKRQNQNGGWDYYEASAGNRGDTSITGWCVMALKSARAGGVLVPETAFLKARAYLVKAGAGNTDSFSMAYCIQGTPQSLGQGDPHSLTGIGLALLAYLGTSPDSPGFIKGSDFLVEKGIQAGNFYGLYYGTLAQFQRGGEAWRKWNEAMQKYLLPLQEKQGQDVGSFAPGNCRFGGQGGRVYTTAMGTLCLEVYYRYLPVYQMTPGYRPPPLPPPPPKAKPKDYDSW